jgi:hypothetical protein
MNAATLKWLAIATVALLLVMMMVDRADRTDTVAGGEYLLPGLKDHINDIDKVVVTGPAKADSISIARDGERWQVQEKGGYPADVGKLRTVLLALANARRLEEKTSNPERFAQLGLGGPEAGSGVLLEVSGSDLKYSLIVGNAAQSKNRYVRIPDDDQSWLIDKNPDLPASSAGWLAADLLDIDGSRIKSVTIRHEDGEIIRLNKASADDANLTVSDIPKGRELSYATVANGIGGVLNDLKLEDVRRSDAGTLTATSIFTTFNGLEVSLRSYRDESDEKVTWIAVSASALPLAKPEPAPVQEAKEEATEQEIADEVAIDDTSDSANTTISAEDEATAINERHAGWEYKIPQYKANMLAKRWSDILKAKETEKDKK